jgi:hypothetical protein
MIHPCLFQVFAQRMHGLPANSQYTMVNLFKSPESQLKSHALAAVTDLILLYLANNPTIINFMARYFCLFDEEGTRYISRRHPQLHRLQGFSAPFLPLCTSLPLHGEVREGRQQDVSFKKRGLGSHVRQKLFII